MQKVIAESDVEENVLAILESLGYSILRGDNEDLLPGGRLILRKKYSDVVLVERLNEALRKLNPSIPKEGREQAVKQVLRSESQKLIADNESFHRMFVDGIDIQVQAEQGEIYKKVWLYDFDNPENNDFLAANQFTVIENHIKRRLDVIIFVNGIPLLVIELKNL